MLFVNRDFNLQPPRSVSRQNSPTQVQVKSVPRSLPSLARCAVLCTNLFLRFSTTVSSKGHTRKSSVTSFILPFLETMQPSFQCFTAWMSLGFLSIALQPGKGVLEGRIGSRGDAV